MKTIEERAEIFADELAKAGGEYYSALEGYIRGATEQKEIDEQHILFLADAHEHEKKLLIEKACEWLKNNAVVCLMDEEVDDFIDDFREAMKGE